MEAMTEVIVTVVSPNVKSSKEEVKAIDGHWIWARVTQLHDTCLCLGWHQHNTPQHPHNTLIRVIGRQNTEVAGAEVTCFDLGHRQVAHMYLSVDETEPPVVGGWLP